MKMMEMTETMDTVDCWRTSVESVESLVENAVLGTFKNVLKCRCRRALRRLREGRA